MTGREDSTSLRWFRRLLRLYPRAFRERFGDSMTQAFAAELDGTRGVAGRVGLWLTTVVHAVGHAAMERGAAVRGTRERRRRHPDDRRHRGGSLDGVGADVRIAGRTLVRQPGYSLIVVATLALGIGANTAIFNLVNAFLFAPLPFGNASELVHLRDVISAPGQADWWYTPTPRTYFTMREEFPLFSAVGAHQYRLSALSHEDDAVQVVGAAVSDGWLETIRVEPVIGRGFNAEERRVSADARVVLLGHGLWQRVFGGDPAALDRAVRIDGEPYTVIGVMPPGFRYPWSAEMWLLENFDRSSGVFGTGVVARKAPGVTDDALRAALPTFSATVAARYPDTHRDIVTAFVSMREQLFGNRPGVGLVLLGAVGVLLLIACVNVAGLAVVRVLSRERELAVRAALGSRPWRNFRLVFLEGAMLASIGGALGLALAWLAAAPLAWLATASESGLLQVGDGLVVDGRVALFAVAVTAIVSLITGVFPAVRAAWAGGFSTIGGGERGGMSRRMKRLIAGVVIGETGLAVVLLVGAGLIYVAYDALASVDRGYVAEDRVAIRIALPDARFADSAQRVRLLEQLVDRLAAEPGVLAAGYTHHLPVSPGDWTRAYSIEGIVASEPGRAVLANVRWVGPSYFAAMGMPWVGGRSFTKDELERGAPVVVLSADLARKHFGNEDPVGRRFKLGELNDGSPWLEIVGVVAQAHEEWAFRETFYLPYTARALDQVELVAHVTPSVGNTAIRKAVRDVDPDQPADQIRGMSALEEDELRSDRAGATVIGLFGVAGLLLSMLGTYGVIAYAMRQRRREMGIRVALGSDAGGLVRLVVREGTGWLGVGVAVGVGVAALGIPAMTGRLVATGESVQVHLLAGGLDVQPSVLAGVAAVMFLVGIVACLLPARRVSRQNPIRALRQD